MPTDDEIIKATFRVLFETMLKDRLQEQAEQAGGGVLTAYLQATPEREDCAPALPNAEEIP